MKYKALMDTHQDTFERMNKAIPLRPSTSPPPSKCDVRCHSKSKYTAKRIHCPATLLLLFIKIQLVVYYQCCALIG